MSKIINNIYILELNINYLNSILDIEKELLSPIFLKEDIINAINNPNYKILGAKINNILVGYVCICFVKDSHIDIESLVVRKDYRKLGVASLLLNNIFSFSRKMNIKEIFLEVRVSNIPAINLYTKNGFNKVSIRKRYYKDNFEDAIIFKKSL